MIYIYIIGAMKKKWKPEKHPDVTDSYPNQFQSVYPH